MSRIAASKTLQLGSNERDHGVLVTARLKGTDRMELIHIADLTKTGDAKACLLEACEQIEALGPDWCVETICTPRTIYTDLQGVRVAHHKVKRHGGGHHEGTTASPWISELRMLSQIGKSYLLTDRCPMPDGPAKVARSGRRKNLRD